MGGQQAVAAAVVCSAQARDQACGGRDAAAITSCRQKPNIIWIRRLQQGSEQVLKGLACSSGADGGGTPGGGSVGREGRGPRARPAVDILQ